MLLEYFIYTVVSTLRPNKMLEPLKLQEIKKSLPHGALKNIQKSAGVSYLTVIKFFKGKSENRKVAEATIEEVRKHTLLITTIEDCLTK